MKWHRNVLKYSISSGYITGSEIWGPKHIFKMMVNISRVSKYVPVHVPTALSNDAHSLLHYQKKTYLKIYLLFISFASLYLPCAIENLVLVIYILFCLYLLFLLNLSLSESYVAVP